MWMYIVVFLAAVAVDTIPIFAPPAWIVLVFLVIKFRLNPWVVITLGVLGSTIGRYILTLYIPKVSSALVSRREDVNLRYLGERLGRAAWSARVFVFLYTLTPLSTTALFTAAGMARVNPWLVLPAFFCGRLVTDGVMVLTGKYASENISELLHEQMSWKTIVTLVAGLLVISAFLFTDWRYLLEKHKLRLKFKVLKGAR